MKYMIMKMKMNGTKAPIPEPVGAAGVVCARMGNINKWFLGRDNKGAVALSRNCASERSIEHNRARNAIAGKEFPPAELYLS